MYVVYPLQRGEGLVQYLFGVDGNKKLSLEQFRGGGGRCKLDPGA